MAAEKPSQQQFAAEQDEFATFAGSLTDEQWATQSLCERWTVRDAVVHTAWHIHLGARTTPLSSTRDLALFLMMGSRRFDRHQLERDGTRSDERLVDWLRSPAQCSANYLCELMIHQQDVRRPLGLPREIPADRLVWLLNYCLTGAGNRNAGRKPRDRAKGLRLVATDLAWSAGQGPEVRGTGEAIVMTLAGRRGVIDEVSGPGVTMLAGRAY